MPYINRAAAQQMQRINAFSKAPVQSNVIKCAKCGRAGSSLIKVAKDVYHCQKGCK